MPVRRRGLRIVLVSTGGVVVVLGLAQLLLPVVAAQRVRSQLGRYGDVESASVSAFPAIELLWGHAQSATARVGTLTMTPAQASAMLGEARGVDRLDLSAQALRLGSLTLHRVSMVKRGAELHVEGTLAASDLRAALPGSVAVQPLGSVPGGVEVRVTGNLFGASTSLDALLSIETAGWWRSPRGSRSRGLCGSPCSPLPTSTFRVSLSPRSRPRRGLAGGRLRDRAGGRAGILSTSPRSPRRCAEAPAPSGAHHALGLARLARPSRPTAERRDFDRPHAPREALTPPRRRVRGSARALSPGGPPRG